MALGANTKPPALLSVTESNFGRWVINSPLPVVALFGSRACPASRALRPLLHTLASVYAGASGSPRSMPNRPRCWPDNLASRSRQR